MDSLSVIVPVYNAEEYLVRCLDSLLKQGVDEYEIVCVNDGSTDASGAILQYYQKLHPDVITVIEQENQGLPAARNKGMEVARGNVITFCDADDYLISGAYRYLLETFWKDGVDLLKFHSMTLDKYVLKEWTETNDVRGEVLYEGSGIEYVKEKAASFSFVWSYFYRKSFMKQHLLRFLPIRQCEDVAFNLDVYMCDPYMMRVSSNVYRYTVSPGQITRVREPHYLRAVVESYVTLMDRMNAYIQMRPELRDTFTVYKQQEMIPCISRVLSVKFTKEEFRSLKESFQLLGGLPMSLPGKFSPVINVVMDNYGVFAVAGFLYRRVFLPLVLPQLRRN